MINTPRLESLSVFGYIEFRWLALHLEGSLFLVASAGVASLSTTINLQVIKLYSLWFSNEKLVMGVLQLLQKSPNLCELYIRIVSIVKRKPI
nr:F-box/FBD/LRR-repeat protein At1g13570-like [Ipomoea batatas]